jgi:3-dehydroquinate synthase
MRSLAVRTRQGTCEVRIGAGATAELGRAVGGRRGQTTSLLIDSAVDALHGRALRDAIGREVPALVLPGGERCKDLAGLGAVLGHLARTTPDREALLVVAGGGAVSDVGGLAAALFLRGIDYVLVPTTLLAMVDSSIGGKTAVDLPEGKNLAGAFHQPALVLDDLAFLATLPARELVSGLGEVAKVAIGLDAGLLELLEREGRGVLAGDLDLIEEVVYRCARAKAEVVAGDERDVNGGRRGLNLGHTLGHALEAAAGFGPLRHGEAVAIGLRFAVSVAVRAGSLDPVEGERFVALLDALGLPARPPAGLAVPRVLEHLARDKKRQGGSIHFVLPAGPGRCAAGLIGIEELAAAARGFLERA